MAQTPAKTQTAEGSPSVPVSDAPIKQAHSPEPPASPRPDAGPAEKPKKRRRRRRKGAGDTQAGFAPYEQADASARSQQPKEQNRGARRPQQRSQKQRRRSGPVENKPGPLAVVKSATEQSASKAVELPLTQEEILELKRQFRFLREHRKQLKLKLNAQEDLLLNGAREPEHRGVCQHLLSKVDYSRVVAAAETLAPKERLSLVEGVMQFSSELSFLLLYLECLKDSGHAGATAALSHALSRIDFAGVSEGQMRRVLELIVELFPSSEQPKLLLGLLESRSFRTAFDGALQKLPNELQEMVAPLRAVHEVVLHGRKSTVGRTALHSGLRMLLEGGLSGLDRRSPAFRERLLSSALRELDAGELTQGTALSDLVDSFKANPARHALWQLRYVSALLQTGNGKAGKRQLNRLFQFFPNHKNGREIAKLLDAPRVGPFALLRMKGRLPFKSNNSLKAAVCLTSRREVWIRFSAQQNAAGAGAESNNSHLADLASDAVNPPLGGPLFEQRAATEAQLLLPSVAPQYATGETEDGRRYVTYLRRGENAASKGKQSLPLSEALHLGTELLLLSSALSQFGWVLPDYNFSRFEIDAGQRLWLMERWDVELCDPTDAKRLNFERLHPVLKNLLQASDSMPSEAAGDTECLERALGVSESEAVSQARNHEELISAMSAIGGPTKRGT